MEKIVQVITSLFKCVKNENVNMISDIKDLREVKYHIISDLMDDISTLEKKVNRLNVKIDNINRYEHGDVLVISGDIIPHGTTN